MSRSQILPMQVYHNLIKYYDARSVDLFLETLCLYHVPLHKSEETKMFVNGSG